METAASVATRTGATGKRFSLHNDELYFTFTGIDFWVLGLFFFGYFPRTIGVNRNERLDVKYDHFFLLNFHIEKKNEMTTFSFPFTVLQF